MSVKILMADGDLAILELAQAAMSSAQWCELVTVNDGHKAAEYLENQKFDGVVLSDQIPHVDGFELIQCLKYSNLNVGIPIVMLTAQDDIDTMRRGFKAGVTFSAVKPNNRERFHRLFNAVRGAMETERRRHYRLPYRTSVNCNLGEGLRHFVAESMEISEGGISLKPSGGVSLGQIVELELLMPQTPRNTPPETKKARKALFAERDQPVVGPQKVRARVRYIAPGGESMGLDFLGLTGPQREVIQHYIDGAT